MIAHWLKLCTWFFVWPQRSHKVKYLAKMKINQTAITSSGDVWHIWYFGARSESDRGKFSNKTVMWSEVNEGSKMSFLLITWDRSVCLDWELHHCNQRVVLIWYDPWLQFDLRWPVMMINFFLCFLLFLTPFSDLQGTFRSKKSMGWPPCDLHVRSYRRSKFC